MGETIIEKKPFVCSIFILLSGESDGNVIFSTNPQSAPA